MARPVSCSLQPGMATYLRVNSSPLRAQRLLPERELLGVRPVAAHRDYFPLAAHGAHERRKRGRALALEEYVRARQGGG